MYNLKYISNLILGLYNELSNYNLIEFSEAYRPKCKISGKFIVLTMWDCYKHNFNKGVNWQSK